MLINNYSGKRQVNASKNDTNAAGAKKYYFLAIIAQIAKLRDCSDMTALLWMWHACCSAFTDELCRRSLVSDCSKFTYDQKDNTLYKRCSDINEGSHCHKAAMLEV